MIDGNLVMANNYTHAPEHNEEPDGYLQFNRQELLSRRKFQWGQSFFIDLGEKTLQIGEGDMISGGKLPVVINTPYERILEMARSVAAEQGFEIQEKL